jgi:hypothetical protein
LCFLFGLAVLSPQASHSFFGFIGLCSYITDCSEFDSRVSPFTASYFFSSAKKSNQKKPSLRRAPRKKHGVPIDARRVTCCARTHPRKTRGLRHAGTENPRYPPHLNGLADVRESQKQKNRIKSQQNKTQHFLNTVFDFDFQSTLASHLSGSVIMSFLRQHV